MIDSLIEDDPDGVNNGMNTPEYSVSEISGAVKRTVEGAFGHVRVRGELGRVTRHRNGHIYLDLKDDRAVLAGVVWRGQAGRLDIAPTEGDEVIATGRLTTFAGQSKYQLVIESLAYAGEGALLAKRERLRVALEAEGLFAAERKRAIPFLPDTIGVITSPTGAVIRDILHRVAERFPVHVLVWPVAVQGPASAPEVADAIRGFGAIAPGGPVPRPDVLIVARGGGSVEDLWGFNEEIVVRAAAASPIPLISAVGHETDTTLIDFAADRRAPTPTAAAEIAVPVRSELAAVLADLEARRVRAARRGVELRRQRLGDMARALPRPEEIVASREQRLDWLAARLPRPGDLIERRRERLALLAARMGDPREILREARARFGYAEGRLPFGLRRAVEGRRMALDAAGRRLTPRLLARRRAELGDRLEARAFRLQPTLARRLRAEADRLAGLGRVLNSLGYEQTLRRGFAVVRGPEDTVLTRAGDLSPGMALTLQFADGRVGATAGEAEAGGPAPTGEAGAAAKSRKSRRTAQKPKTPASSPAKGNPGPRDGSQGSLF